MNTMAATYLSLARSPTHRFYEFTVLHQLPFVFDLVGCHPRLDLVSKTLGGGGAEEERGGEEVERGRQRKRYIHIIGVTQNLVRRPTTNSELGVVLIFAPGGSRTRALAASG